MRWVCCSPRVLWALIWRRALRHLPTSARPKGRGQRHSLHTDNGAIELIDESYNANPVSMRAALELLAAAPVQGAGRRIAVLGDMLELGTASFLAAS